ncbi:uncharacterized protein orion [Cloeon dipterum]|uniref:uncharacterized protein orion n=1 Tax=Cloeon dipterum TaxID=197152 RepID=UPI0032206FEA
MEWQRVLLALLLAFGVASGSLLPRTTDVSVAEARRQLLDTVSDLRRRSESEPSFSVRDVTKAFQSVDDELSRVDAQPLPDAATGVQLMLDGLWPWASALSEVRTTDAWYQKVRDVFRGAGDGLEDTAAAVAAPKQSDKAIDAAMLRLHEVVVRPDAKGLFKGVAEAATEESGSKVCALEQSPQQLIYNLYNLVALAELRGYALMQFSWMILKQYEKGNFTREAELLQAKTELRSAEKAAAASEAMKEASRFVWRCDPKQHVENETYVQLTELLQGYVQNEVDLNPKASCGENCAYYTYAKVHGCYHNQYCSKQRKCAGRVFDCQFVDSDSWVCPSEQPSRRYDYIEFENGRVLGRPGHCSRGTTKVDSWWRWLFWHCSYCFCTCDDDGPNSDRYISLRPSLANVSAGYAVIGMRFVKLKRVVHVQVRQARVGPRGVVEAASAEWLPLEAFDVAATAPGRDYHKMDYEQRSMDLDDLTAPPGYVLTGVRFRRIGTHLNPEILATPMDMAAGTLNADASLWIGNDNTDAAVDEPRTGVPLTLPDVPTRSVALSEPDSKHDQFVTFTHTDVSKDAAQTTVPFLDAQPVAPEPPVLLSGAGIYHKGRRGYGGFVGLRLITYDFSDLLGANRTDAPLN